MRSSPRSGSGCRTGWCHSLEGDELSLGVTFIVVGYVEAAVEVEAGHPAGGEDGRGWVGRRGLYRGYVCTPIGPVRATPGSRGRSVGTTCPAPWGPSRVHPGVGKCGHATGAQGGTKDFQRHKLLKNYAKTEFLAIIAFLRCKDASLGSTFSSV